MGISTVIENVCEVPTLIQAVVIIGRAPVARIRFLGLDLPCDMGRRMAADIVAACERADDLALHFEDGLPGSARLRAVPRRAP